MKIFVDGADIAEIRALAEIGIVDGVTTNPSIIAKSGKDFFKIIKEITEIVYGPVSAEVVASDHKKMVEEGLRLRDIAENVTVKVPLTLEGLRACNILSSQDIMVNVTLCFSTNQALLAAKCGATFVSPFVGRLDDIGEDGMSLIADIVEVYRNYEFDTEVLVASVRNVNHCYQAALIGADAVTAPSSVIRQLVKHPLTDSGLDSFLEDWQKTGQKILGK
jgi:transaldolase